MAKRVLAGLSYVIGIVALVAVIVDSGDDEFLSFHAWQALLVNIVLILLASLSASFLVPMYVRTLPLGARPGAFIGAVSLIMGVAFLIVVVLGVRAFLGHRFRVSGIAWLAERL